MADRSPEVELKANFQTVFNDLQELIKQINNGRGSLKSLQNALNSLSQGDYGIKPILPGLDKQAAKQLQSEVRQLVQMGTGQMEVQVQTAVTNALVAGLRNQLRATVQAVQVEVDKLTKSFSPQALVAKGLVNDSTLNNAMLRADQERKIQQYMRRPAGATYMPKNDDDLKLYETATQRRLSAFNLSGDQENARKELELLERIRAKRQEITEQAKAAAEQARKARQDQEAQAKTEARIADSIARLQVRANATTNPVAKAKVEVSAAEQALNLGRVKNVGKTEMDGLVSSYEKAQARLELLTRAQKEYDATVRDGSNKARRDRESQEREIDRLQKQIDQFNLKANSTTDPIAKARLQAQAASTALSKGQVSGSGKDEMTALSVSYEKAQQRVELLTRAKKEYDRTVASGASYAEKEAQINAKLAATTDEVKRSKLELRLAELQLQKAVASGSEQELQGAISKYRQYETVLAQTTLAQKKLADAARPQATPRSAKDIAARSFEVQNARLDLNGGADQFAAQGRVLTNYAIMGGVIAAFKSSIDSVREFEQSLAQLQAISGSTTGEMAKVRDVIMEIAVNSRYSAKELSEGATVMAQAGFTAAEIGTALKPITEFATATGTSMKEAVDTITSAMSVFKLRTEEAANVADLFTAALNDTKLDPQKLALGLQYVSNVAADANVNLTELTAVMGALSNAGIRSGSTIATGLRQLIIDLSTPSEKLKGELGKVGLSVEAVDIKSQGLVGVLRNLQEAGFSSANAMRSLEVRAANAYSALGSQIENLPALIEGLNKMGSASDANATQMDTLNSAIIRAQNVWTQLSEKFFGPSLTILKNLLNAFSELASGILEVPGALEIVGTAFTTALVGKALVTVTNLTFGLAKLVLGIGAIGTASTTAAVGVGVLNTAISSMGKGNLIILGVTAAVTAGVAVWEYYSQKTVTAKESLDKVNTSLAEVKGRLDSSVSSMSAVNEEMSRLSERSASFTAQDFPGVIANLRARFGDLGFEIDNSTNKVGDLLNALSDLKLTLANRMVLDLQIQDNALRVKQQELLNQRGEATTPEALAASTNLLDNLLYNRKSFAGVSYGPRKLRDGFVVPEGPIDSENALRAPDKKNEPIDVRIGNLGIAIREYFANSGDLSGKFDNNMAVALKKLADLRTDLSSTGTSIKDPRFSIISQLEGLIKDQTRLRNDRQDTDRKITEGEAKKAETEFGTTTLSPLARQVEELNVVIANGKKLLTGENVNSDQRIAVNRAILKGGRVEIGGQTQDVIGVENDLNSILSSLDNLPDKQKNYQSTKLLRDKVKSMITGLNGKVMEAVDAQDKYLKKELDTELQANSERQKTIRAKLSSRNLPANSGAVASLRKELEAAINEEYDIKEKQVRQSHDLNKKPTNAETDLFKKRMESLAAARKSELERVQVDTDSITSSVTQVGDEYNDFIDRIKDNFKNIASQLKVAIQKNKRPVTEIDQLIASAEAPQNRDRVSRVEMESLKRQKYEAGTEKAGKDAAAYEAAIQQYQQQKEKIDQEKADAEQQLKNLEEQGRTKGNHAQIDARIKKTQEEISKLTSQQETASRNIAEAEEKRADAAERYRVGTAEYKNASFSDNFNNSVTKWKEDSGFNKPADVQIIDSLPDLFKKATDSFDNFVFGFASGTDRIGQSARKLAMSVIESFAKIATNKLAGSLFGLLLDGVSSMLSPGAVNATASTDVSLPIGDVVPVQSGGFMDPSKVRRMSGGGHVFGGFPGRDSVPTLLDPGEYVLRRSAVNLVGRDYLDQLNSNGNRVVQNSTPPAIPMPQAKPPEPTNIWVVTPDQVPPPSEKDIITMVGNNIATNGPLKRLVKQVAMGV